MAYVQLDELTDAPVRVELDDSDRIRIRYGHGASISLDTDEALDLAVDVVAALIEAEPGPRDPIDPMRSVKASGVLNFINDMRREIAELTAEARETGERNRKAGQ